MEYPKAGEMIKFGSYDWRILDVQDGQALILTEKVIEQRRYHHSDKDTTWVQCELRYYLNGEFFDAFSEQDKERIAVNMVINNDNPWYGSTGGINAKEMIFLLSLEETVKYFGDSGQLKNRPEGSRWISDQYNSARIAYDADGNASAWRLRSPGNTNRRSASVNEDGSLGVTSYLSHSVAWPYGVRPALWLKLEPRIYQSGGKHHAG